MFDIKLNVRRKIYISSNLLKKHIIYISYTVRVNLFLCLAPDHKRARTNLIHLTRQKERQMADTSSKMQKPVEEKKEKKLKPHQRKRYDLRNFDWPTEKENYKRLCRGDEILTYMVTNSPYYIRVLNGSLFPFPSPHFH